MPRSTCVESLLLFPSPFFVHSFTLLSAFLVLLPNDFVEIYPILDQRTNFFLIVFQLLRNLMFYHYLLVSLLRFTIAFQADHISTYYPLLVSSSLQSIFARTFFICIFCFFLYHPFPFLYFRASLQECSGSA